MGGPTAQPPVRPSPAPAPVNRFTRFAQARVIPRGQVPVRLPRRPLRFKGQMPGERVIWIKRQAPMFLLLSGWPIVVGLLALIAARVWLASLGTLAHIVLLAIAAVVALYTIRWALTDLWNWYFRCFILTDSRVIASRGYFQRTSEEVVLKNVSQVLVERPNPLAVLLQIGTVMVRPIGTPLAIPGVARPRDVADSILAMQENPNYGLPATAASAQPVIKVKSKKLQDALDALAMPAALPPSPIPRGVMPLNTLLHRKIPVKFIEGESVVEVVYRHWFVLLRDELPALAILIGASVVGVLLGRTAQSSLLPLWLVVGGIGVALLLGTAIYMNWADDVFVLTTHRVIDIDRLIFLLAEYSNDAPYARIQDVHVERNWLGKLLGYGSIAVETSGRKYPVKMNDVPNAFGLMDRIFAQINLVRERESVAAINKQKKENYRWMATVINDLVAEVPDVRGLPLLEAAGRLRAVSLRFVVEVERPAVGIASGIVLEQNPNPGANAIADSEVRVVLSRQAVLATP